MRSWWGLMRPQRPLPHMGKMKPSEQAMTTPRPRAMYEYWRPGGDASCCIASSTPCAPQPARSSATTIAPNPAQEKFQGGSGTAKSGSLGAARSR